MEKNNQIQQEFKNQKQLQNSEFQFEKLHQFKIHKDKIVSAKFSRSGNYIVSGSVDNTVRFSKTKNGRIKSTVKFRILQNQVENIYYHQGSSIYSVDIQNSKRQLIAVGDGNGKKSIFNPRNKKVIKTFYNEYNTFIWTVKFGQKQKVLLTGSHNKGLILYNYISGKIIQCFRQIQESIETVDFAFDDKLIIAGSADKSVQMWNILGQNLIKMDNLHQGWVFSCSLVQNNPYYLVTGSYDKSVKVWDITKEIQNIQQFLIEYSQVKKLESYQYQEIIDKNEQTYLKLPAFQGYNQNQLGINYINDLQLIAFSDKNINNYLIQIEDHYQKLKCYKKYQPILEFQYHTDVVRAIRCYSKGSLLCSVSWDKTMVIYDLKTLKQVQTIQDHEEGVLTCDISYEQNKIISGSRDASIIIYNIPKKYQINQKQNK